jgi:hypothetical protein
MAASVTVILAPDRIMLMARLTRSRYRILPPMRASGERCVASPPWAFGRMSQLGDGILLGHVPTAVRW